MPSVTRNGEEEQPILSREDARRQAEKFKRQGGGDPYLNVPRALLSADHIIEYAKVTGMIAPLYDGDRMKKASYQGKIGENAYEYNESGQLVRVPINDELIVKESSIVFVECDIDFRLPDFMAVRFNLHIRHVHRGLLLGTGPLVDPGYWGKLCIPLHNLTDRKYAIPRNAGLIWIEFTKTSRKSIEGRDSSSSGAEYWDIHKFIERSAGQYGKDPVAIRSSIVALKTYRESVESARKSAEYAEKSSKISESNVKKFTNIGYYAAGVGALAVILGVVALFWAAHNSIQSAYNSVHPQADDAYTQSTLNEREIRGLKSQITSMEEEIRDLRGQIIGVQDQDNSP